MAETPAAGPNAGPNAGHERIYDASAKAWAAERGGGQAGLFPEHWLIDELIAKLVPGAAVLDLGCGTGAPIAAHLAGRGFQVLGVDFSEQMLALARARLPEVAFLHGDMRDLDLGREFTAIIAWDSFFHLTIAEQLALIPRLAAHLQPKGWLLFRCGPDAGEAWGQVAGGPVYHAALSPAGYARAFEDAGMIGRQFGAEQPQLGGRSYWLVQRR